MVVPPSQGYLAPPRGHAPQFEKHWLMEKKRCLMCVCSNGVNGLKAKGQCGGEAPKELLENLVLSLEKRCEEIITVAYPVIRNICFLFFVDPVQR
ncbi:hypothetical protein TNCV_1198731 [Trichonephila clavipes]|uniref:Uncharacterized protein n=1 Tax=Trichonephila clavipes TaxID=2585209 RepID=A0A8X6S3R2_TRICX|nr:hypothetical protein TNCV_1198731 [Trichonephila clavipes]